MADPQTISKAIEQNAKGPAEASVDGQSVKQHKLADQIEADRYAKSNAAASRGLAGIVRTKAVPPSTA